MSTCRHCKSYDSMRGVCLHWDIVQSDHGLCDDFTSHIDGESFDRLHARLQQAEDAADKCNAAIERANAVLKDAIAALNKLLENTQNKGANDE